MWPNRCAALAKRSLQYMLPFGLAATLTGTVFVDRGNRERAMGTMDHTAVTIRQNKVSHSSLADIFNSTNSERAAKKKWLLLQKKLWKFELKFRILDS